MAGFSLYYSACANMKHHRNSVTSLHLGECDGCLQNLKPEITQHLTVKGHAESVIWLWLQALCSCPSTQEIRLHLSEVLKLSLWNEVKTSQASEPSDFGIDVSQFCIITEHWDEKLKQFLSDKYTQRNDKELISQQYYGQHPFQDNAESNL